MSDYVPLPKDIAIDGWNMRMHAGPLMFSATLFDEEDKALLRSWLQRAPGSIEKSDQFRRDIATLSSKYKGSLLDFIELITREQGLQS